MTEGYERIPPLMLEGIQAYVETRRPTGDCLYYILSNDLKMAFAHADDDTAAAMKYIVKYLYNKVPMVCWGSEEKVTEWLKGDDNVQDKASPGRNGHAETDVQDPGTEPG